MNWWRRLLAGRTPASLFPDPTHLSMNGWALVNHEPTAAYWRDPTGDVINLTLFPVDQALAIPKLSDTKSLQNYCRAIAESQSSGLVEVTSTVGAEGPCVAYIYKRLRIPAFTFFGVVATPVPHGTWTWLVVAYERGTTGVREAVITSKLVEAGQLTLESYEASWAQDPYDPSYRGVDGKTLRYVSDAEEYDAAFPDHPLTKVRRELRRLVNIRLSPSTSA
jgi:hypothetical protein